MARKSLYDNISFREGFALIENQSDEKATIARFISEMLIRNISKGQFLDIVDLAGGTGTVWRYVSEILNKNNIVLEKLLQLTLVDSSQNQIKEAKKLQEQFGWFKCVNQDAASYLSYTDKKYDVITCIHFLPQLLIEAQKQVFNDCKKALNDDGFWLSVQPNNINPLTKIKRILRKEILNIEYESNYLNVEDLRPNIIKVKTISSKLVIRSNQFIPLAYFLLGKEELRLDEEQKEKSEEILMAIATKNKEAYEIELINDYLLFKNG